jgi:hypothetical protein
MVTIVRPRQLPGVALLGLLVALLAHTASYGGDHIAGGAYHTTLELLALAGAGGFAVLAGAFAWIGARRHADGSVLAARLSPLAPSAWSMAVSGAFWFFTIEHLEPEHPWHAPLPLIALCLAVAAALVAVASRALVRAIAGVAFAIALRPFARRPVHYRRCFTRRSSARRAAFVYRRFVRPPPAVMLPA